jgi:hypothetical protein
VLRADPCDLDHDAERIFVRHHPESGVPFARIAVGYAFPDGNAIGGPLVGVGRYVAQGMGEHAMIAVCVALGNAIRDACGADLLHMPIRQEDVWRALGTAKAVGESSATIRPRAACTARS